MSKIKLVVTDVDFTILNWVVWWYNSHFYLFDKLHEITRIDKETLYQEAKQILSAYGSLEYPFLIQSLPSVQRYYFGSGFENFCDECLRPAVNYAKKTGTPYLKCFPGALETLAKIHDLGIPIAVLTDAPRYVGLWRLSKMGVLPYLDAVWGLEDPLPPICKLTGKVLLLPETLQKHINRDLCGFEGHTAILPNDYEKPDPRGLGSVLLHYGLLSDPKSVLWIGDNPQKDVKVGKTLGVQTVWAQYGITARDEFREDTEKYTFYEAFTNSHNERKNACTDPTISIEPDHTISEFSEILSLL